MKILIKQATITDPASPYNGQVADILLDNGLVANIAPSIGEKADQEINASGWCVSPGWVDVFANFGDPGYEYKEVLETGAAAAAAGGFTDVFLLPNTNPCIHNKAGVAYLVQKGKTLPISIYPIGAITRNTEGKELAEMYDMRASGAIAFSDGIHAIQSAGLLVKALQYVKAFGGQLIQLPDDASISPGGLMTEGIVSTRLGLPGKPAMAEELIVARDIKLTVYAESRLHLTAVSTANSLDYIRQGKIATPGITCSTTPYHVFFCDEDLQDYNTNLKVNPPLRTRSDRDALRKAVLNGTIDCIATHHLPHEYDSKVVEFEYARPGMIGLETAYAVLNTAIPEMSPAAWVSLLSINPRKLFGLKEMIISEGNILSLTFFSPDEKWTVAEKNIRSRSKNTPFIGKELTGKVKGIYHKNQLILND